MKIIRSKDLQKELADELDKEIEDILSSERSDDQVETRKAQGEFADKYHHYLRNSKPVTIRLSLEMIKAFEMLAAKSKSDLNSVLLFALKEYLQKDSIAKDQ